ncbi:hypothetical protein CR152_32320 (plasmid) [Massilia violaceinigra]|uniref:ParB-like N-terminal domain-containing protein n=1 Tax=Massilia violaceinigra TaxID=2045208 RepID=A0A2D2DW96_9BURK|nr:ParB/RepB/Spo0J family partition protein [Massilia violaceinigra]ATQ79263.1 hypothetical protein CR152_32320 [Massilia violaceinigra]
MSNSRPGIKVSGLISSGKVSAKEGVQESRAFDVPTSLPDSGEIEQIAGQRPHLQVASSASPMRWEVVIDELHDVDVDLVYDSPFQTEEDSIGRYDPESIDELAHTMANAGQQEPVVVRWVNGRFELIAGHRRIRAARSMGWTKIRARIVKLDDTAAEKGLMVHNEGRKENTDYKKAKLYARAKAKGYARTQDELAHMFATKQGSVSKRLAMLTLPEPILKMLDAKPDLIGMGTAKTIHELVEELPGEIDLVVKAVERIKEQNAPENSVRAWVAQMVQSRNKVHEKKRTDSKPKVITDPRNRQLYTAKLEGRVITLRVSAMELDPVEELALMVEYFQNKANAIATATSKPTEVE